MQEGVARVDRAAGGTICEGLVFVAARWRRRLRPAQLVQEGVARVDRAAGGTICEGLVFVGVRTPVGVALYYMRFVYY